MEYLAADFQREPVSVPSAAELRVVLALISGHLSGYRGNFPDFSQIPARI